KNYLDNFNSYHSLADRMMACLAVMSNHWTCFMKPKCENNKCDFVLNSVKLCGWMYEDCKYGEKGYENNSLFSDYNLTCRDIIEMCGGDEGEGEEEILNLTINILYPSNDSLITANEIYINATTEEKAVCNYTIKIESGDSVYKTTSKEMEITNKKTHSQLIEELQNSRYKKFRKLGEFKLKDRIFSSKRKK
ncbi:MAG: hypothetical protein KKH98_04035, partial [Spirochaetes bacterium]|nr:hypothetical protein [Spirochaetota bacterium]